MPNMHSIFILADLTFYKNTKKILKMTCYFQKNDVKWFLRSFEGSVCVQFQGNIERFQK